MVDRVLSLPCEAAMSMSLPVQDIHSVITGRMSFNIFRG